MEKFQYSHSEFRVLDSVFFEVSGVPPPLVQKSWIEKVEAEIEDNLNLAVIAQRIKDRSNFVKRKRGRPKKLQVEVSPQPEQWFLENTDTLCDDPQNDWVDSQGDNNPDVSFYPQEEPVQDLDVLDEEEPEVVEGNKGGGKKGKPKFPNVDGIKVDSRTVYPCPYCNKTFKARSTLKYHYRSHSGELLKCDECGRGFITNYLLKCHMRVHTGELFTCHVCNRGFTTAELLKVHRRRHTGERPFACDQCPKRFRTSSNLTQHKETHLDEKKYLCPDCGASFNQKRCLDCHMLIHSEKTQTCSVCGKQWARKSDLVEHMRVHTKDKPFQCELCEHRFTQASSLKRHVLTHQEFDPRMCQLCDKVFRCEIYYQRHLKRHLVAMQET